jgi:biopolymer transport protein ExbB/TolQ
MKQCLRITVASAVAAPLMLASAVGTAQEKATDVVQQRQEMVSLNQKLEQLKAKLEIAKTQQELQGLIREQEISQMRANQPAPPPSAQSQPTMTREQIREQIREATAEIERQKKANKPRDNRLDAAYVQESYQPREKPHMEAVLNINGQLFKVAPGSVLGDWKIESVSLGMVTAYNKREDERKVLGDGSSVVATPNSNTRQR